MTRPAAWQHPGSPGPLQAQGSGTAGHANARILCCALHPRNVGFAFTAMLQPTAEGYQGPQASACAAQGKHPYGETGGAREKRGSCWRVLYPSGSCLIRPTAAVAKPIPSAATALKQIPTGQLWRVPAACRPSPRKTGGFFWGGGGGGPRSKDETRGFPVESPDDAQQQAIATAHMPGKRPE